MYSNKANEITMVVINTSKFSHHIEDKDSNNNNNNSTNNGQRKQKQTKFSSKQNETKQISKCNQYSKQPG